MNLIDVLGRSAIPEPWAEGEKIPWDDPAFSQRMLQEHLSQDHDAASRRARVIDRQVAWIHNQILDGEPTRILDLGCGPGLYTSRLAKLGHECVGIDFGPASVAYAQEHARQERLNCTYMRKDIRHADYGRRYGLVMLIFGEFNTFRPVDARLILKKAQKALGEGAALLLEPHTHAAVREEGERSRRWDSAESGLFSDRPHLLFQESNWDVERQVATERYYIVDAESGEATLHASSMQAYTDEDYRALLGECGFGDVTLYPSLIGEADASQSGLLAVVANKAVQ